jgi:hypothetical protein
MSRLSISLLDFCRTGHFSPITLGMTKRQVEQVFGKPQNWGGSHPEWSRSVKRKAETSALPYTNVSSG